MKPLLTSLLLLAFLAIHAQTDFQTITGKITDANSGDPLPYCSVYIKGKSIGTVSNEKGEFTFNVPSNFGNDSLTVSHVGFQNFFGIVNTLPDHLIIELNEAIVDLNEISVQTKGLTGTEILNLAIVKIQKEDGYPTEPFRLDAFYRELHTSNNQRTGVVECAVEIFDNSLTDDFKEIIISQFRKVYDKKKNTDEFIETKAGHNHLLLLLNSGINLIPLAKNTKNTIWNANLDIDNDLDIAIEKVTYFNDRLVCQLSHKSYGLELRLLVDVEDYSVYKNELILKVEEEDHQHYAWRKVNTKGEKCGAILDHQSYEYRKINGKLFPYYFFRKMDFRCYDLLDSLISTQAYFSTELLFNSISTDNIPKISPDKFKRKKGLVNRIEPYDSAFWQYFNAIQDVPVDQLLIDEPITQRNDRSVTHLEASNTTIETENRTLKIGDHSTLEFTRADTLYGSLTSLLTCYDVTHYDLDLDIDIGNESIKGISQITFKMVESSNKIRLDLFESRIGS